MFNLHIKKRLIQKKRDILYKNDLVFVLFYGSERTAAPFPRDK